LNQSDLFEKCNLHCLHFGASVAAFGADVGGISANNFGSTQTSGLSTAGGKSSKHGNVGAGIVLAFNRERAQLMNQFYGDPFITDKEVSQAFIGRSSLLFSMRNAFSFNNQRHALQAIAARLTAISNQRRAALRAKIQGIATTLSITFSQAESLHSTVSGQEEIDGRLDFLERNGLLATGVM